VEEILALVVAQLLVLAAEWLVRSLVQALRPTTA
jgi:hypothetical protein